MMKSPRFIEGGIHKDSRGIVSFVNDFNLDPIKRLYVIEHHDTAIIRAWQAHKIEQKWFYVIKGSFQLVVVEPDDWKTPSEHLEIKEFLLSDKQNGVLHVPGGFATGFKALCEDSKMMVFSDSTIEESKLDEYRFEQTLWFDWTNS